MIWFLLGLGFGAALMWRWFEGRQLIRTRTEYYAAKEGTKITSPARHGKPLTEHHYHGQISTGARFVYCPVGNIVSWNDGDYANRWCHYCKKFYENER